VVEQFRIEDRSLDEQVAVTKEDMVREGQRSPLRDKNPNGGEFTVRELIRLALVESDGSASDVLIRVLGGADKVQAYLTQIGIQDMKVVNTEKEIGKDWETQYQNWATPKDAAELLRYLCDTSKSEPQAADEIPEDDRNQMRMVLIRKFMFESVPGEKRLKGLLPGKFAMAHKTGTSGSQNGITAATNDIGTVYLGNHKTLVIAVFVSDSPADEKTRELVIAKIAKAVWDKWAK
jgi:beta-lactamase class A